MQSNAALGNKWHPHAIFQHANAGAVPWEVAIHALVVESIQRDKAISMSTSNLERP
ncbi:hypothetical protein C8R44DRAFT_913781 [Mycena epipterygia]|nr:hypothetical protein C8R44DRAFT_913781 [Mycena epipterygia]